MPNIELLNVDCLDYMRTLPDKSFELAICDPPYGIGGHEGNNHWVRSKFSDKGKDWDNSIPDKKYFTELYRVSVNQIIFGANYFTEFLPPSMGWVCWFKTIECVGRAFSECEFAYTSFERAARVYEQKPFQKNGTRIHPTQKPMEMYRWLLHNYAQPGNKILDTHGGSRSLAIACHQMGFDHVSCEIDLDYHNDSVKRFNNAIMQQSLF